MSNEVADRLEDLPPSAKLVYKILEYEGPRLSQEEILEHTTLTESTASYAITRLDEASLLQKDTKLTDARKTLYSTNN